MTEIPSAKEYADALEVLEGDLPESYRKILLAHYAMPNRDITATQLAEAVGYKNYNGANLHYGKLSLRVGKEVNRLPSMHMEAMVTFEHREGEWHWIMRPQVAEALEILGRAGERRTTAMAEVPTTEQYMAAFRATGGLTDSYLKMLQFQHNQPDRAATARQLANAVGYKNHNAANLNYGTLGNIVGKHLKSNLNAGWKVLSTGSDPEGEEFNWIMRPQVAEALEALRWTNPLGEPDPPVPPPQPPPKQSNLNTILFGPPGTGKTYSVQRRAVGIIEALPEGMSDNEISEKFRAYREERRIEFVTFHPSFSYEEFVEGFRYDPEKKTPTLNKGVFREIAGEAEKHYDEPYVLIIDEINRGNISRIFGELITLLEPDKRLGGPNGLSVKLPYSQEDFSVPGNLHVIGTMNTADRSIALLDIALRRRFEFEEMMPDVELVQEILTQRGSETDVELICEVFQILNARISALLDRDHQIGHSYFLSATSPENLHHALYKRIFPLLQEYFYNDAERLKELLGKHETVEGEERGFVRAMKPDFGRGFPGGDRDHLWEFHDYGAANLQDALQRTFTKR